MLVGSFAIASLGGLGISTLEENIPFTHWRRVTAVTLVGLTSALTFLMIYQLQLMTAFKAEVMQRPSFSRTLLIISVIFIGWIFYGLGAAAIFPIRRANGSKPIPYRVPGYPWTPILFVLAAAAIVGNAVYAAFRDPGQFQNLTAAIVLFAIGLPAYLFWRKRAAA